MSRAKRCDYGGCPKKAVLCLYDARMPHGGERRPLCERHATDPWAGGGSALLDQVDQLRRAEVATKEHERMVEALWVRGLVLNAAGRSISG